METKQASDMLAKLYNIKDVRPALLQQMEQGVTIRKALAGEKHLVTNWIRKHFSDSWASEAEIAICNDKRSCFIATKKADIIGFSCYDSVCLGFFGPMGVHEASRGNGTGRALLLAALLDMKYMGYGYAIIGWTHLLDFYQKAVDATKIPDSSPGVYRGYLG